MRVLALDWGTKRIGAAVSDETGAIAFALDRFFEREKAIPELIRFVSEKGVGKIIIGNPLSLSGAESQSSLKASEFAEELRKKIDIPIEMLDERLSSVAAKKNLSEQGLSQKQGKDMVDNMAAALMLQQYLENLKFKI